MVVGSLVLSVIMWAVFVLRETRASEPILNPRLFRNRIFGVSSVASALQMAGMYGAIMFLPLFVQGVEGRTATNSGIVLMPLMIAAIVTSIGSGQILARTGKYKIVVVVAFAAVTAGSYLLSRMGVATSQAAVVRNMIVMGLGLGVAMSTFTVIVQNQYPAHRLGEVSAGLQFFRSIGATIGLAVFGTILNNRFASSLQASLSPQLKALTGSGLQLNNPQVLLSDQARAQLSASFDKLGPQGHSLFATFMDSVRQSLATAIASVFLLAMFVSVVAFVAVLFLKEVPLRRTHSTEGLDSLEGRE